MSGRVLLLVTVALTVSAVASQVPQQPPIFRSGAELVRVDVTVLNGRGEPEKTLTADDFSVEEDGIRQKILSFAFLDHSGAAAPGSDASLEIGSAAQAAMEVARDDVRVFVVFWDEYHIPPNFQANRLRQEIYQFLRTMMRPTDVVAIMDQWTPTSHLRFTRDLSVLMNTAMSLKGREGVLTPPRNVAEENHLREWRRVGFLRAQVSLSALKSTMVHLGSLRQGRTSLLYVSREFGLGRQSFAETLDLIQAANDANVAVYSINPDGLGMGGIRTGILTDLARNTGGEALLTNSPAVAFKRAVVQSSASYLLGYAPEPLRQDGKFHKIKVSVGRSGLQVRARNGYWAPTPANKEQARAAAAEAAVAPPIEAAFGELARLDRVAEGSRALRTIAAADGDGTELRITNPDLWVVRRPADMAIVLGADPPPPHEGREFFRTERLIVRCALSGTLAGDAAVRVELVDRRGKRLAEVPVRREAAGWLLDLPLSSIARGDYVLAFRAAAGDRESAAYLPIRVKP